MKYRREIDGLRAVAVIAVIVYHAEFTLNESLLLRGGFLGVDIFFVISGFLITFLMIDEFQKTGRVSISSFYERRARRILPALLFVMFISIPFAWFFLLPDQLIDYAQSLISSLLFVSNFYWNYSLQQYGVESALFKPFLHTWSLAVEEQYYIIFPLIFIVLYRWLKRFIIVLIFIGFLSSLLFSEWMTLQNTAFSFYMLPSRFWEFLAGGSAAYILHLYPQKSNNVLLDKTMPTLGIILIFYSFFFTTLDATHPGFITLLPVVGTILIILFANEKSLVIKFLSSKYMTSIGLISYSLYLWHYPVFAFSRISWGAGLLDYHKISLILLSILLAITSYYWVERPFRMSPRLKSKKYFIVSWIIVFSLILCFSTVVIVVDGFQNRYDNIFPISSRVINTESQKKWLNQTQNHENFDSYTFFSKQYKKRVLILGDSHTAAWAYGISTTYKQDSNIFLALSYLGCYWKVDNDKVSNIGPNAAKYNDRCNVNKELLNSDQVAESLDTIILASYRPFSYGVNLFRFDLLRLLQRKNPKVNIVILGDYYQLPVESIGCWGLMQRNMSNARICLESSDFPPPHYDYKQGKYYHNLDGVNYVYVNIINNVCKSRDRNSCPYEFQGIPFIIDTNHLTPLFTRYITELMRDRGVDLLMKKVKEDYRLNITLEGHHE
ncbi:MAG: acyltransferase [Zetaproteobacteria bacterium]|nr:acyltransferase [Zetaproteobacteria bacterium]